MAILYFILTYLNLIGESPLIQKATVYECNYLLKSTSFQQSTDTKETIPLIVDVKFRIITDGNWYLIHAKSENINLGLMDVNSLTGDEDSFLIRVSDQMLYNFSDKKVSKLEFQQLGKLIHTDSDSANLKRQYSKDSTLFISNPIYPASITPFPQFTDNLAGITSIKNKKITCTLQSINKIDFNFSKYAEKLKLFTKSNEIIGLPF